MRKASFTRRYIVLATIPGWIEEQNGSLSGCFTLRNVMDQRIRILRFRVLSDIVSWIEISIWPAAFAPAMPVPMHQRFVAAASEIDVARHKPSTVKQAGALKDEEVAHLRRVIRDVFDRCKDLPIRHRKVALHKITKTLPGCEPGPNTLSPKKSFRWPNQSDLTENLRLNRACREALAPWRTRPTYLLGHSGMALS